MFSSKSKNADAVSHAVASAPAGAGANQIRRAARPTAVPSLISADLIVNGTLTSSGDIQIDGRVDGDVHSTSLVIGEKAVINGEIVADDVTVRGRVEGGIRARRVVLASTCHVDGTILHESFTVEAGAFFEGHCRRSDNPRVEEHTRVTDHERKPAVAARPTEIPAPRAVAASGAR